MQPGRRFHRDGTEQLGIDPVPALQQIRQRQRRTDVQESPGIAELHIKIEQAHPLASLLHRPRMQAGRLRGDRRRTDAADALDDRHQSTRLDIAPALGGDLRPQMIDGRRQFGSL